jgi:phage repressor protein C with HTH and peptisase S24 domain
MSVYQGEKFKKYLDSTNISTSRAAILLGVSRQTVYQYYKTDNLTRETVSKILTTFSVYEEEIWGKQESKVSLTPQNEVKLISQFPNVEESEIDDKYLYAPDGSMGMKVYTVPAKAQAGYLSGYPDPEYYESFDFVIIPVDKKHSSDYLSFEVTGDSMVCLSSVEMAERSIFPGRIAVGRLLQRDKWYYKLHIHNYDYWVIAHKTKGILIKSIINHDVTKGIITIHSLNPDYKDEDLKLDDIEQMFSVVQIVNKTR